MINISSVKGMNSNTDLNIYQKPGKKKKKTLHPAVLHMPQTWLLTRYTVLVAWNMKPLIFP